MDKLDTLTWVSMGMDSHCHTLVVIRGTVDFGSSAVASAPEVSAKVVFYENIAGDDLRRTGEKITHGISGRERICVLLRTMDLISSLPCCQSDEKGKKSYVCKGIDKFFYNNIH